MTNSLRSYLDFAVETTRLAGVLTLAVGIGALVVRRNLGKSEALGEAKRWLRTYTDEEGRRPFQHPTYWSGFILIGDPR